MDTSTTETEAPTVKDAGEQKVTESETISINKKDWDITQQTLGSLKRQIKDLTKPKEEAETPQKSEKSSDLALMEKGFLRMAGYSKESEVKLALDTAKKWGMTVDQLIEDDDWKVKIEKHRTNEANLDATSEIKGAPGSSGAKNTAEHWLALGRPPSASDVPDRKTRQKIARAFINSSKNQKTFYNE